MPDRKKCLDCIREDVPEPRERSGRSSYCTRHTYIRTQQSTLKRRIEGIVDADAYKLLEEKRRDGTPVFSNLDLIEAADRYKERTMTYYARLLRHLGPEQRQKIYQYRDEGTLDEYSEEPLQYEVIARQLKLRRKLTFEEYEEMRLQMRNRTWIMMISEEPDA